MRQFAPDHVVVAGDMVNWGPFSAEVMQIIHEKRWTMIRGNNEYYCINALAPRRPDAWASFTLLDWLRDQVGDWHYVLAGLPDDLLLLYPDAPDVHLCHGIPGDCWTGIYAAEFDTDSQVSAWLAPGRAQTVFCGHTHIPLKRTVGDYHIFNPGSVGVPLLGESVSSYMILDGTPHGWKLAHHRTLPLNDLSVLMAAWEDQQFHQRGGTTAQLIIEEFKQARVILHGFNTWMKAEHPDETATNDHVTTFLAVDSDPYVPKPYLQSPENQYVS